MKVTLEEEQTKQLIKKYYSEVEETNIDVGFSIYEDRQYTDVVPVISKMIEIGGIKLKATEEIKDSKIKEILGYFLSDEYEIVKTNLTSYRVYENRGEYVNHIRATVEVEPVKQKTRGLNK